MNTNKTIIFILLASVFVISRFFEQLPFSWLLKLLPMIFLIGVSLNLSASKKHKLFIVGLIFSALGDLFLEIEQGKLFIYGLGAFFIAHIFYIRSLMPIVELSIVKGRLITIAFYCGYGLFNLSLIYSNLGALTIPVVLYMSVLMLLGLVTLLSSQSNLWLIFGGISFIISDSLIGLNKFYTSVPYASILIMISYYFAQFALVRGVLGLPKGKNI